jgi:hypothetical protein
VVWYACPLCQEVAEYDCKDALGAIVTLDPRAITKHWHVVGLIKLGLASRDEAEAYVREHHAEAVNEYSVYEQQDRLRRELHHLRKSIQR